MRGRKLRGSFFAGVEYTEHGFFSITASFAKSNKLLLLPFYNDAIEKVSVDIQTMKKVSVILMAFSLV